MSVANQDNAPSHLPNPVGNDGGIGLSLQPLPLAPLVVSDLHANLNLNPSSTRTSVTRVENDEEGRLRPSMTSEPVAIVAETTPAPAHVHGANSAPRASPVHEEERDSGQSTPEPTRIEPDGEQVRVAGAEGEGDAVPQTPQTYVTFLVISGKRRTLAFEPSTTVGRVKELVWNSWSADWQDERPPAPSYLRVLYLGRLLQDDETLSNLKLPVSSTNSPVATIMHLSIRPYAIPGQGDSMKKKKRRGRSDTTGSNEGDQETDGSGCCRCIVC